MSTNITHSTFRHWDDCKISGCPGHAMRVEYQNTADVFTVYIDDEYAFGGDPAVIGTFISMVNNMRGVRVEIDSMMKDALEQPNPLEDKK